MWQKYILTRIEKRKYVLKEKTGREREVKWERMISKQTMGTRKKLRHRTSLEKAKKWGCKIQY